MSTSAKTTLIADINLMINTMHNPALVDPTKSPNDNLVYHVYSDGKITSQKGGWAYLTRLEFVYQYIIRAERVGVLNELIFPIHCEHQRYAIVTKEDAVKIRVKMIELCSMV